MTINLFGRALAHRNYRLFLLGQGISLIGTWMQQVATAWLLYRLTNSAFLLGVIAFTSQIPGLLLSPIAGVAADRWNRHRALLVTQTLAMVQAVLVLFVVQSQGPIIVPLIALGFFLGCVNAFDMPLRQSFLIEMVPNKEHLGNAIALNSSIVNGSRLVGPSIAGLVIAHWGESTCFLLNACSYLAVLWALLAMRDLKQREMHPRGNILADLKEGFGYAFRFAPLRSLLLLLSTVSIMSMSMSVLMPVFARDVLSGNADTQGFLMGAMGVGALTSALHLAMRKSVLGLGRIIVLAAVVYGMGQIAFSYSSELWLSAPILILTGGGMMMHLGATNIVIQTIVEEDKRGRVMSLYTMAFLGVAPFGSLLGGILANRIGAPATVRISGGICIFAGLVFGRQLPQLRMLVRPIYEQAGILTAKTSYEPLTPDN